MRLAVKLRKASDDLNLGSVKAMRWGTKNYVESNLCLAILYDLFGMFKWPFQRLSDLQLGDNKAHIESPGVLFF